MKLHSKKLLQIFVPNEKGELEHVSFGLYSARKIN